jgi:hypothetical protein
MEGKMISYRDLFIDEYMKAVETSLLKDEELIRLLREEYHRDWDENTLLHEEEIVLYLNENGEDILISGGDWSIIGDSHIFECHFEGPIRDNIYLLTENKVSRDVTINVEAEFHPYTRDIRTGKTDAEEGDGIYLEIGQLGTFL